MSYLVLARRERPQLFADVVGQQHVVRTLQNAIRSNRVHHAYLFCGTRGVGKTSTARILAKALGCDRGPAPEPCNECSACREITDGNAVDVIEVDAATHRGVEEAQRFLEGVPYRPARLRYKFYIIDEVHMMTRHAFNALLKTFEEPPPHVKFVLATTEAHQVPDTILSRCQRFDFRELGAEEIASALGRILEREGVKVSARARSWVVREARGSMRDALSLLDQILAFANGTSVSDEEVREVLGGVEVELIERAIQSLVGRDPDAMLAVIGEVVARGHDLKSFLASLLEGLRAAMVAKAVSGAGRARSAQDQVVRLELFEGASLEDVVRWVDQGLRCQLELQRTEDPRLTLEAALVRATLLGAVRPLAEALARLEALESRLGGGAGGAASGEGRRAAPASGGGGRAAPGPAPQAPPALTTRPISGVQRAPGGGDPPSAPAVAASELSGRGQAPPLPDQDAPVTVAAGEELPTLFKHLKIHEPRLMRWLDRARSTRIEGERVVAMLEPGLSFDELSEPESRDKFREAARACLGRALSLELLPVNGGAPSAPKRNVGKPDPVDTAQARAVRTKALEDPLIKQSMDLWPGTEVVDVKPLPGGDEKKGKRS